MSLKASYILWKTIFMAIVKKNQLKKIIPF